jgi:two-component system response regulator RegA
MKKFVIVDDDVTLVNTLQRRLSQPGWQLVCFSDPVSALQLASQQAELYLLDLRFAQQSGLEFIPVLRQQLPKCRIVVLTGYASIQTAVHAIKLGADDYLTKPVDFQLLKQSLFGHSEADSVAGTTNEHGFLSAEQIEWEHIQRVLAEHQGNISHTATSLGMHRRTLQRKLLKHRPS